MAYNPTLSSNPGNFSLKPGIFSLERCNLLILGLATTKASGRHSLADAAVLGEMIEGSNHRGQRDRFAG